MRKSTSWPMVSSCRPATISFGAWWRVDAVQDGEQAQPGRHCEKRILQETYCHPHEVDGGRAGGCGVDCCGIRARDVHQRVPRRYIRGGGGPRSALLGRRSRTRRFSMPAQGRRSGQWLLRLPGFVFGGGRWVCGTGERRVRGTAWQYVGLCPSVRGLLRAVGDGGTGGGGHSVRDMGL
jgi:hypothetical protein